MNLFGRWGMHATPLILRVLHDEFRRSWPQAARLARAPLLQADWCML